MSKDQVREALEALLESTNSRARDAAYDMKVNAPYASVIGPYESMLRDTSERLRAILAALSALAAAPEVERVRPTKEERGHRSACWATWDSLAVDYLGCTCKPPTRMPATGLPYSDGKAPPACATCGMWHGRAACRPAPEPAAPVVNPELTTPAPEVERVRDHLFVPGDAACGWQRQCSVKVPVVEAERVVGACCGYPPEAHAAPEPAAPEVPAATVEGAGVEPVVDVEKVRAQVMAALEVARTGAPGELPPSKAKEVRDRLLTIAYMLTTRVVVATPPPQPEPAAPSGCEHGRTGYPASADGHKVCFVCMTCLDCTKTATPPPVSKDAAPSGEALIYRDGFGNLWPAPTDEMPLMLPATTAPTPEAAQAPTREDEAVLAALAECQCGRCPRCISTQHAELAKLREAHAELIAYVDDAKRELGDLRVSGEPLPQSIASLRKRLEEAERKSDLA